jgi:1-acyl-sn-glycerol-3-phosphate acyltransferase
MSALNWHYNTAKDSDLSFVDRLKECPREPDPLVYAARISAALAIRAALRIFHRFDIIAGEHLPRGRSFILVANHTSHLDALALLSALPLRSLHRAYPLAARDYFAASNLRLALTTIVANVMLFDRNETGLQGLMLCKRMLDQRGNVLVMFPEGTRSIDGRIGVFRRGIGLLLAGTQYPVLPCYLDGTSRAWPKGSLFPRPARMRLVIGEARTYQGVEHNDGNVLQICADLRRAVITLAPQPWAQTARPISKEAYR